MLYLKRHDANDTAIKVDFGTLLGQVSDITDYSLDTGEGKFVVITMIEALGGNDIFVIV